MPKKIISIRFDEQLQKIIDQEAQKKGIKPSEYIRGKLAQDLKEFENSSTTSTEHIETPVKASEEKLTIEEVEKMIDRVFDKMGKTTTPTPSNVEKTESEPVVEQAEIELSDDELDAAIKEAVKPTTTTEPEKYVCGGCSYISDKEFNPCPKCGNKLKW